MQACKVSVRAWKLKVAHAMPTKMHWHASPTAGCHSAVLSKHTVHAPAAVASSPSPKGSSADPVPTAVVTLQPAAQQVTGAKVRAEAVTSNQGQANHDGPT